MPLNESKRTTSSEGAPGLPMLVLIGVLFVAAVISTWVVYQHVPPSSMFGGMHSGTPAPVGSLGYVTSSPSPFAHAIPSHGATSPPTADVQIGVQWNAWDWDTASLLGATMHATLQRAVPGSVVLDSETTQLATTVGAIDERFWSRAFEGPFETFTSEQRAAVAADLATALEPLLVTPGFDGIVRIELCFVLPDGTFERYEVVRDPADPRVLVARPQSP